MGHIFSFSSGLGFAVCPELNVCFDKGTLTGLCRALGNVGVIPKRKWAGRKEVRDK